MQKFFKIIVGVFVIVTLVGCTSSNTSYNSSYTPNSYNVSEDECIEPENPYSRSQEGHYAGYEWAEKKDPSRCGGNSDSFIEGCDEYLRQAEEYENCLNN